MKILILGRNKIKDRNWVHQLFLNNFRKFHDVIFFGEGHETYVEGMGIPQVVKKYGKPDLILCYLAKKCMKYKGIEKVDCPKIHIEIDFMPKGGRRKGGQFDLKTGWNRYGEYFKRVKFDLAFAPSEISVKGLIDSGSCEKALLLPFSVDTSTFKDLKLERVMDVSASFKTVSHAYKNRSKIQRYLKKMKGVRTVTGRYKQHEYVKILNRSKIAVTSNNIFKSLSMKYTETLACRTLLLADKPEGFDELGFEDRKHLVLYSGLDDLFDKVRYFLKHDQERNQIAKQGMEFVIKHHSNKIRIKQLNSILAKELFGGSLP